MKPKGTRKVLIAPHGGRRALRRTPTAPPPRSCQSPNHHRQHIGRARPARHPCWCTEAHRNPAVKRRIPSATQPQTTSCQCWTGSVAHDNYCHAIVLQRSRAANQTAAKIIKRLFAYSRSLHDLIRRAGWRRGSARTRSTAEPLHPHQRPPPAPADGILSALPHRSQAAVEMN
jgi:hypothetical protein